MLGNIWKGALSFGLINIPVKLLKAEEERSHHFTMLDKKDFSPIKYKKINSKTGNVVPYDQIVKGHEYQKNQFVILTENDFKSANVQATQTIDLDCFIDTNEVDLLYLEKPYYIVPDKNGEKGYWLLTEAMKKARKAAIGKIVLRNKQHLALVLVRGEYLVLDLMRFSHEVINADKANYYSSLKKVKFSTKELDMALNLIKSMTAHWKPEKYEDTYYDDLEKIIQKKIKAGKGQTIDYGEIPKIEITNNVIDLMPLLKRSLAKKVKLKITTRKSNLKQRSTSRSTNISKKSS